MRDSGSLSLSNFSGSRGWMTENSIAHTWESSEFIGVQQKSLCPKWSDSPRRAPTPGVPHRLDGKLTQASLTQELFSSDAFLLDQNTRPEDGSMRDGMYGRDRSCGVNPRMESWVLVLGIQSHLHGRFSYHGAGGLHTSQSYEQGQQLCLFRCFSFSFSFFYPTEWHIPQSSDISLHQLFPHILKTTAIFLPHPNLLRNSNGCPAWI